MWYNKIVDDLAVIPDFISYYEKELIQAKAELKIKGSLEKQLSEMPGIVDHRFSQIQEIDAILQFLNLSARKIRSKYVKIYKETYPRELGDKVIDKYIDGEEEVFQFDLLINEVSLIRNKWLGITKSLESKGYNLGTISRLRIAGMEDANI